MMTAMRLWVLVWWCVALLACGVISKDEGASTAVAVVPVPVKPVPASDVPASDVVISQELADAEKRGVYNLVTPIPIFQTALTSKRMVLTKNPMVEYAVNCLANHKHFAMDKDIGTLEKLSGERIFHSEYRFDQKWFDEKSKMGIQKLCTYDEGLKKKAKKSKVGMSFGLKRLSRLAKEDYRINLMLPDGLRAQEIAVYDETHNEINPKSMHPQEGLGIAERSVDGQVLIRTAWKFVLVRTEMSPEKTFQVLSFYALPDPTLNGATTFPTLAELYSQKKFDMVYRVEVKVLKGVSIDDRDSYNSDNEGGNEPLMIFNWLIGICVVLITSLTAGVILVRTIFKDITLANKDIGEFLMSDEEKMLESGWKLVHADVFRAPVNPILMCATIGFGLEIVITIILTSLFGAIHFLDLTVWMFFMYIGSCVPGGYMSARFYKSFGGERWKLNVALTFVLYPFILLSILSVANTVLWATNGSDGAKSGNVGAVDVKALFLALAIWLFIGFPMTFAGSYFGFKREAFEYPVRTNLIPRQIPAQTMSNKLLSRVVLGGLIVFLSFFIQLFFVNDDLLEHGRPTTGLYAILVIASLLSAFVCAMMGLISTYRQLTGENYHWWWQSMMVTGSSGFYVFVVLCILGFDKYVSYEQASAKDSAVNAVVFFCLVSVICICVSAMNAVIGFISSWMFVRKLYSAVRVD